MPTGLLIDIVDSMPQETRLLGLDVGKKTIGLALCDVALRVVTPLKTIKRQKLAIDVKKIQDIIEKYEVNGFIVGLPLHMDGTEGRRAQSVRDFAAEFAERVNINDPWIAFVDERLSTNSVEGFVDQSLDMNRRQAKTRGVTDQLAAAYILEDALAHIKVE